MLGVPFGSAFVGSMLPLHIQKAVQVAAHMAVHIHVNGALRTVTAHMHMPGIQMAVQWQQTWQCTVSQVEGIVAAFIIIQSMALFLLLVM